MQRRHDTTQKCCRAGINTAKLAVLKQGFYAHHAGLIDAVVRRKAVYSQLRLFRMHALFRALQQAWLLFGNSTATYDASQGKPQQHIHLWQEQLGTVSGVIAPSC